MKTIEIHGEPLQVLDQGSGTPILLVHGFPLDHGMWQHQIDALAGHCRVIAPDLRGFGQSTLSGDSVQIEMTDLADDLYQMLGQLEVIEPVIFCGLSMGGYIAWQFWRKYPNQLAALIISGSRVAADSAETARGRLVMAQSVVEQGSVLAADTFLPNLFSPETFKQQPEVVESVRQTILKTSPRTIAACQRGMANRPDVTDWLSEMDLPVLTLTGEHDPISPPQEMRAFTARMPEGRFVEIPAAGHLAPLENPEAFNAALFKFLGQES